MNTNELTPQLIRTMSYTDFVGLVNQWNVLPGAFVTLTKWVAFSGINSNSSILEVACTTGFSSREIAKITGCHAQGFDLSAASIRNAEYNAKKYAPDADVKYMVANGYDFQSPNLFSHVIVGAALRFFPDPEKMVHKIISLLRPNGYILANEFYVIQPIPSAYISQAQKVFGITPTTQSYKEVMGIYKGLNIYYEDDNAIREETTEELHHYTESTIDRASEMLGIEKGGELYTLMYDRLLEIKQTSNVLRPYQRYTTLVLKYDPKVYPHRYVELF